MQACVRQCYTSGAVAGSYSNTSTAEAHLAERSFAQCSLRTVSLSLLSMLILFLLALLFHPSSPYAYSSSSSSSSRPPSSSYYSGAGLPVGTYSDDGPVYKNPLPSEGKFADIPFATVGGSRASASAVPQWAGGDGGDAQREQQWAEDMRKKGRQMRWNGTSWFGASLPSLSGWGPAPS